MEGKLTWVAKSRARQRSRGRGRRAYERTAQATINQDLDLIKSCIEVTRMAARRAAVLPERERETEDHKRTRKLFRFSRG